MDTILKKIRTVEERDRLLGEIEILEQSLFEHKGMGLESALKSQVRSWVAEEIRSGVSESLENTKEFLRSVKDAVSKSKVLKLKIAFEPTNSSIDKFYAFAVKNIGKNVVLELEIDPLIYGGAEITYEGEYRDFSLKRLFEKEYKEKESEIMELITVSEKPSG